MPDPVPVEGFGPEHSAAALNEALAEHRELVETRQLASEWALENVYYKANDKHQPAPFTDAWLDLFTMDGGPEFVFVQKAVQIGYTRTMLSATAYLLARKRRDICIYFPTDSRAKLFAKRDVDPMILNSPPLKDAHDVMSDRRSEFTQMFKRLNGASLLINSASTAAQFTSVTANVVILDEMDRFDKDVESEGSPVELAHRAARNQPFPKFIGGSSPTTDTMSLIHDSMTNCSMTFKYYIPCPHCGEMQTIEWENMKFDGPDMDVPFAKDMDRRARSVRHVGKCCGAEWRWTDMKRQLKDGQWRTEGGEWIETGGGKQPRLFDAGGERMEWPEQIGFMIWTGYSPWFSWRRMVRGFLNSQRSVESMQVFHNHTLGLPWRENDVQMDADSLRDDAIDLSVLPNHAKVGVVAIDVQKDYVSWMLLAFGDGEDGWIIDRGEVHGAMDQPDGLVWGETAKVVRGLRLPPREDGAELRVDAVVMDTSAGQWTQTTYEVIAGWSAEGLAPRVYAVKGGSGGFKHPTIKLPPNHVKLRRGGSIPLYSLGVDQAKVEVAMRLQPPPPREGAEQSQPPTRLYLSNRLDERVFHELTAEQLTTKRDRYGRKVRKWRKIAANEAFDQAVYALCAVRIMDPWWAVLNPTRGDVPDVPAPEAPPEPDAPSPYRSPARGVPRTIPRRRRRL